MTDQINIQDIDTINQSFFTWVIKYCSTKYAKSIFFIWYTDTDENSTDRLLTFNSGEIFAVNKLENLKENIIKQKEKIVGNNNLYLWLDKLNKVELVESVTYDIELISTRTEKGNINDETIEAIANFVNLYGDYIFQDNSNKHLQQHYDNELIQEIWTYYYDYLFWPRFNDKEKFEKWNRPKLEIDNKKLLPAFIEIVNTFEERIRLT